MKFKVQIVSVTDEGQEDPAEVVLEVERTGLSAETLGLMLAESKELLAGVQDFIVEHQVEDWLEQQRPCPDCGRRRATKGVDQVRVRTVFGKVTLSSPRWRHCRCRPQPHSTFRPLARILPERSTPELLFLETKLSSLVSYGATATLLREILPVDEKLSAVSVRNHLMRMTERAEAELGEERACFIEGCPRDWAELPTPDGPVTVGLDGGYVRAAHSRGCFEVVAGKAVLSFARDGPESTAPKAKRFGFVQTYDTKPKRRLWELLRSLGLQSNQELVFLSDGGEDIKGVQELLHPGAEHWLDWFHVTMRITVLRQQTKSIAAENADLGRDTDRLLEKAKHYLWHGNVFQALQHMQLLEDDLECLDNKTPAIKKVLAGLREFQTYIENNGGSIPNYGERYRQGETISTAFVESTVNQVVSKRMSKKQQMRWTPRGAHLLLQARTKVLNGSLEEAFRGWYPDFRRAA